jgi:hypothetical protein
MKTLVILLSCVLLSGCHKCAYGYSATCGAVDAYDQQQQQQQDQENKDKKKEKAPSASWN